MKKIVSKIVVMLAVIIAATMSVAFVRVADDRVSPPPCDAAASPQCIKPAPRCITIIVGGHKETVCRFIK